MFFNLLFFVLGLVIGSFISALSFRIVRGIQFTKGRSFCDRCRKKVFWYDNIPLVSYLLLNGKCRSCAKRISIRYPLIELSSGLGFLALYNIFSLQNINNLFFALFVFTVLLAIFVTDLEHKIIPDELVFFGIFVSFVFFVFGPNFTFLYSGLFAGFLAASFLMFINIITGGKGMGLGDVKFAVLGGMLTGIRLLAPWLFLAFLTGAVVAIILILGKKAGLKDKIAFGPFLIAGVAMAFVFGERLAVFLGF